MGRSPCCSKMGLNRGAWTALEDKILREYISVHGEGRWRSLPDRAGLKRCGKSCRLRWLNYLRPNIKRGNISADEEELIIRLHKLLGNRWSLIAGRLPGRTDNEIKNYWNTNLSKRAKDHPLTNTWPRRPSAQPQPIENSTHRNPEPQSTPKVTSSPSPSPSSLHSHVLRPKPAKCSKALFVNTFPHSSMQLQDMSKAEAEPLPGGAAAAANNSTIDQMEPSVYDNGILSFLNEEKEVSTDLLKDFNMGEICLSDLLNSDFSDACDFSFSYNNIDELSPCSDQPQVPTDEIVKSCRQSNVADE